MKYRAAKRAARRANLQCPECGKRGVYPRWGFDKYTGMQSRACRYCTHIEFKRLQVPR